MRVEPCQFRCGVGLEWGIRRGMDVRRSGRDKREAVLAYREGVDGLRVVQSLSSLVVREMMRLVKKRVR